MLPIIAMEENKTIPGASFESMACPMPLSHKDTIVMSHGSGGRMTLDLIRWFFKNISKALCSLVVMISRIFKSIAQ